MEKEKTTQELKDLLNQAGVGNLIPERLVAAVIERIEQLQTELEQQKNDNIDIEDDLSWYKAIFDGSWPTAVEILERTLAKVKAIKGDGK